MGLLREFDRQGNWLFRWRSFLPLAFLVPLAPAFLSFNYPLGDHYFQELWELVCVPTSLLGLVLRAWAVGAAAPNTSGRNTRDQVADSLNTSGIYSVVRHPLYLGNYLMWLGIALFCRNGWFVAVYTLAFFLYYERIMMAEENYLREKFGGTFESWAAATPAFLPRPSLWRPSDRPFSWKKVLRQEYTGLFGITTAFFLLELAEHAVVEGRFEIEPLWGAVGGAGFVIYIFLRTLKKRTALLAP